MIDEIIRRICKQCKINKILHLDFLIADRHKREIICKKCIKDNRKREILDNYMPKHLRGQIGVKL